MTINDARQLVMRREYSENFPGATIDELWRLERHGGNVQEMAAGPRNLV